MRVSREQAAANRERIIEAAAMLYRERGFEGIGVAELMQSVGLTHGGFYRHFDSKEALMAAVCAKSLADTEARIERTLARAPGQGADAYGAFVDRYLTLSHREHPGKGCLFATLGAEVARAGKPVREVFGEGLERVIAAFSPLCGEAGPEARATALATFSTLVGALVLARAVADDTQAAEILAAARAALPVSPGSLAEPPAALPTAPPANP